MVSEGLSEDFQRFSIIVAVCCKYFGVYKIKILKPNKRKTSTETECTAIIVKLIKEYTSYRNIDICFILKINTVSSVFSLQREYCNNLLPKIPRHKELIEKHEKCYTEIKNIFNKCNL
jgi:hypothetical protein